MSQVERALGRLGDQSFHLGFPLTLREASQIYSGYMHRQALSNVLNWTTIYYRKAGAQGFVAMHQFVEAALQGFHVEPPHDTDGCWNGIGSSARLQLLEEPESLLSKGQRQVDVS